MTQALEPIAPSGEQWSIEYADQRLTVVQVGGGIREYAVGGSPVLAGYPASAKADAGRGQLLMPWPNRVRDGKYTFAGRDQQLALTEPARSNASHGLVRWSLWTLEAHESSRLVVSYSLLPQQGWDYPLQLRVRYELGADGLTVTPEATNIGDGPAPFGFGAHPYLTLGEQRVDELTLRVPANTVLKVDDRLIPTGTTPVPAGLDFREPRTIGDAVLDHAFTDLAADGRWEVTLAAQDRRTVVWADATAYPFVQIFTGDTLPAEKARTTGIAIEPMTCPANALATGEHLILLKPGQRWSAPWGIRPDQVGEQASGR
ncbi:galactose mutarotase [Epidermidibacterium keratini]|uniref:Galactose mutarotase n=1 Tax=Epidermidibacterium keratini TaxID=1891644 RepID=A0A7L4YRD4_9ACTN|nr:aldose 1-epimerase family protein [Epidermidibacterium keratini]QHC01805.1 galactose mutarotase [Epidermidibacterium keratini]